jgi:IS30 family transposase
MGDTDRQKAERAVRKAQADYDRSVDRARDARREAFKKAQDAGMTLREIGEQVGLHHTTVGEVIRGD